jgi:hypothetical protein
MAESLGSHKRPFLISQNLVVPTGEHSAARRNLLPAFPRISSRPLRLFFAPFAVRCSSARRRKSLRSEWEELRTGFLRE